jgi:hypothetical protein
MFADITLARRLERTEGCACRDFVEARATLQPDSGAVWTEIAGAYAMFDGVGSPITQTFGLGLFEPATEVDMEALETFFEQRGADVHHEVSPLADVTLLNARAYEPFEFTSVMYLPLKGATSEGNDVTARAIGPEDHAVWIDTSTEGWSESTEYADVIRDLSAVGVARKDTALFLADIGGKPVAAGALSIHGGVALFAGACTVPSARRQGAQQALHHARMQYAREAGCDLAMMCAAPGSTSQRNAERQGFRIAYTRIKWRRRRQTIMCSG